MVKLSIKKDNLFKDIKCGFKPTSCSAQLAIAVRKAYNELKKVV